MAASTGTVPGYQCEFIDTVPEDFHCKQCSLVARRLTITSCCGESYCKVCIDNIQQDARPCPGCGEEGFTTFQQVKNQRKIAALKVCCSMKGRGCVWSGVLEHLDAHLDPDQGDCQYVDIVCPLKCDKKIVRKNIDHHTTKECVKRDYVCPHCAFRAIYEIVSTIHWPECAYYPLQCPNRCGVTCERDNMDYHMKICPLEEVECKFSHAGCKERFKREKEEEHMKENSQKHLIMMAAASLKMQNKLEEQERKFEEKLQEQKAQTQTLLQEQKAQTQTLLQEQKAQTQTLLQEQGELFKEKLQLQEKQFEEKSKELQTEVDVLKRCCDDAKRVLFKNYKFTMENFSKEKAKDVFNDWKSPPMYTHLCGYKFCIGIDANGWGDTRRNSVNVELWSMEGEYDDQLKWPVSAKFTIELINHFQGGNNMKVTKTATWKPTRNYHCVCQFSPDAEYRYRFIRHIELGNNPFRRTHFLKDDSLQFIITDITIMK